MNKKIKSWYAKQKPDDLIVKSGLLDDEVTFSDVYKALVEKKDIYEVLACDSKAADIIRKNANTLRINVFNELANILNYEYDDIYRMYLEKNIIIPQKQEITYTIRVPIQAYVEVDLIGDNVNSAVEYLKASLLNIDCGVFENLEIQNPVDRDKPLIDIENQTEELENIIFVNTAISENPLSINIPVKADFLITVISNSLENALEKVKRNISDLKIEKAGDLNHIIYDEEHIEEINNWYQKNEIEYNY